MHGRYVIGWVLVLGGMVGCGDDAAAPAVRNKYYVAAERAFRGCDFPDCHAKDGGGKGDRDAMFDFGAALAAGDFRTALVDVPSCEYDAMPRVDPGNPNNSWLWVKLTGSFVQSGTARGELIFEPDASWQGQSCNPDIEGFGMRMPATSPFQLSPANLEAIQAWIEAGAPGPNDPDTNDADSGT